jgi:cytosine/adenosine deaminase-related metal-dependent hydrolase
MTDDTSHPDRGLVPVDLRIDGVTAVLGGGPGEQYEIRADVRIGIRDGLIASIGRMDAAPEPAAQTIDGAGHAAIPGMICTHDHVFQNPSRALAPSWRSGPSSRASSSRRPRR